MIGWDGFGEKEERDQGREAVKEIQVSFIISVMNIFGFNVSSL
jgi:hypothetical protein